MGNNFMGRVDIFLKYLFGKYYLLYVFDLKG